MPEIGKSRTLAREKFRHRGDIGPGGSVKGNNYRTAAAT
jgi:hypothetical protein